MDLAALLIALLTLAAGLVAGWAIARVTATHATAVLQADTATAAAERDAAIDDRDRLRIEHEATSGALRAAEIQAAEAGARLATLEQSEAQLKDTFARMSSEALQANRQQFLDLADDRFKQAGRPLTETLDKVEGQLREIERNRVGAQAALKEQIDSVLRTGDALRHETASLVNALSKPQARGQWGELQLRRCVEYAGMMDRCDFVEQASVTTDDGVLRPDMVINLVGGKTIVVDSKVTLVAYLDAHGATDEPTRAEHLKRHARHVRQHIDSLAAKSYWEQFSASPEFVIMFVPGDGPLNAALEQDPGLLEYAFSKRVQILGPMSLVPALRSIAYAWKGQALADNAREVFELGRELYKRLGTMGGHVGKLGRSLTAAVSQYNDTIGSLESKVLVTARKLNDLEVVDTTLVEVEGLDATVRPLTKPELVESAAQARAVVAFPAGDDDAATEDQTLAGRVEDYGIDLGRETSPDRRAAH
jgi:DNA recombination protein RmuC